MITPPLRFRMESKAFYDYWQYEDGSRLLQKLDSIPDLSLATAQVPLLYEKDDLADKVIADCFIDRPFPATMQLMSEYASGVQPANTAPQSVQDLLGQMHTLPVWLDKALMRTGTEVCARSGKSGLIVLRNYSLMLGYQSAAINKPLIATGALHKGAVKRIADTTDFWYEVTGTDALQPGSIGFMHCFKTRLIHAYSRVMIKRNLEWSVAEQGEPLNHWDMLATYLGFSLVFLEGVRKLGFTISDAEANGVYHLWKYIGHLIGIPHQILPDNDPQAITRLYLWSKTQPEADSNSIALAQALHLESMQAAWPPLQWQKKTIQRINLGFNYHLIGRRSCEVLHLPKSVFRYFIKMAIAVNTIDDAIAIRSAGYRRYLIAKGRREQETIRNNVKR